MWRRWWARLVERAAVDPEAAAQTDPRVSPGPTRSAEDDALLNRIAEGVVRWGMTVPAVFLLESSKPLSFVGSQFLHFLSPIAHSLLDARELDRLAVMLERRETVEELIVWIERVDVVRSAEEKARRDEARAARRRKRDG